MIRNNFRLHQDLRTN